MFVDLAGSAAAPLAGTSRGSQMRLCTLGGTAIALRLGHRVSADFDFFSDAPMDRGGLSAAFPFIRHAVLLQDQPDTLTFSAADPQTPEQRVKLSFFAGMDFGRYGVPQTTEDGVLQVASLDDLMATKVKVLLRRVESRDYRDIAAMLKAGVDLGRGLAIAKAMFGNAFQPSESLKAMTYFEGGDLRLLTADDKRTLIDAVKRAGHLPVVEVMARRLAAR